MKPPSLPSLIELALGISYSRLNKNISSQVVRITDSRLGFDHPFHCITSPMYQVRVKLLEFFRIAGRNPLFLYLLSEVLVIMLGFIGSEVKVYLVSFTAIHSESLTLNLDPFICVYLHARLLVSGLVAE